MSVEYERLIEPVHDFTGIFGIDADHNPVGVEIVLYGIAFLQEFGVRCYVELDVELASCNFLGYGLANFFGCAYRDCALCHHDHVSVDVATYFVCNCKHILQVGATILVGRRAYADECSVGFLQGFGIVAGKRQQAFAHVVVNHVFKTRFPYREYAVVEVVNLFAVDVEARYADTHFGETSSRNKSYVARSNNCYLHLFVFC